MVKRHLKRLATKRSWPIKRKGITFITRPKPSGHNAMLSTSLNTLLKEMLYIAKTTKEVKYLLQHKEILVDGIKKTDHRFAAGLFDVISIKDTKENFRVLINKNGKLTLIKIDDKEAGLKPCKVIGKTHLKGDMLQINLNDGKNILTKKDGVKVGDTMILTIPEQKIKEIVKLDKGARIFLTGGGHIGTVGIVENIDGKTIIFKSENDKFETLKKYAFAINRIKVENE